MELQGGLCKRASEWKTRQVTHVPHRWSDLIVSQGRQQALSSEPHVFFYLGEVTREAPVRDFGDAFHHPGPVLGHPSASSWPVQRLLIFPVSNNNQTVVALASKNTPPAAGYLPHLSVVVTTGSSVLLKNAKASTLIPNRGRGLPCLYACLLARHRTQKTRCVVPDMACPQASHQRGAASRRI